MATTHLSDHGAPFAHPSGNHFDPDRSSLRAEAGRLHAHLAELPPTLSVEQAAELVGVGRNAAYRAAHRGDIPSFRVGRKLRIPTAGLLRLLDLDQPRSSEAT